MDVYMEDIRGTFSVKLVPDDSMVIPEGEVVLYEAYNARGSVWNNLCLDLVSPGSIGYRILITVESMVPDSPVLAAIDNIQMSNTTCEHLCKLFHQNNDCVSYQYLHYVGKEVLRCG